MDKKVKYMLLFLLFFTIITIIIPNTFSKYTSTISRTININTSRPRYIIKFDANGGTGSMSDMNVTRAVSQNLTTNTFTRSGYDFIGWNTQSDGSGVSYSDGQEIAYASIANGDVITLYAQWYSKNYLNAFYDFAQAWGTSIADAEMQCAFTVWSIQHQHKKHLNILKDYSDIYTNSLWMGSIYDGSKTAGNTIYAKAKEFYKKFK